MYCIIVLHLFSAFLLQEVGFNAEMEELQKDPCDARALVFWCALVLVSLFAKTCFDWIEQAVKGNDIRHIKTFVFFVAARLAEEKQAYKIICHDNVKLYCISGSRAAPRQRYGGAEAESYLAHPCTRLMRWNCMHVCQLVLGSCSQSSPTQFDSVGHWKEMKRASFWMMRRCPCKMWPKQQGQWQRLLVVVLPWFLMYFVDVLLRQLSYHNLSSREVILLLGLTSYQFPISNRTTVSSDSVPLTGWNRHNAHGPTCDSGAGWSAQRYCVKC